MVTQPRPGTALTLPALTESSRLRYFVLTMLYAAQGVPYGLLFVAVPAYLAQRGVSAAVIGSYVGIMGIPASLNLFYGPIMDRWSFLPMGRRRPWVLVGQVGIIGCFIGMAFLPDPAEALRGLVVMGFAIYFFTMFQDVATDGMAIDVVPVGEQSRANGFMWGGVTLGIAATSAGGAWVMSTIGFDAAVLLAAGLVAVIFLLPLVLRERPGERLLPWSAGQPSAKAQELQLDGWKDIGHSLWQAVILPASLIGAASMFLFRVGVGLNVAALPVLTVQELGWADTAFSNLNAVGYLVGGVLGMVVGGWLAGRLGRQRTITIVGGVFGVATLAIAVLPLLWPIRAVMSGYILAHLILNVFVTIAFLSLSMALCGRRVAATQFAMYMAMSNFGRSVGSMLVGPLEAVGGYPAIFLCVFGTTVLSILLLQFVNLRRHRVRMRVLDGEADPALAPSIEPAV